MLRASRLADGLGLAAAPTFLILAALNALHEDGGLATLCSGGSGIGGMTMMSLLMSAFHATPWIRLIGRSGAGAP